MNSWGRIKSIICLIFKCACVTAPLWGAVIICSTHLLYVVGSGYVGPLWNKEFTNTTQDKQYDVLILGDSTANAFYIPEVLSSSTVNLALPASSTADGYYTLVDYLNNNNAPKDVFISYMDYHLQDDVINWDVGNYIHKYSIEQNQEILDNLNEYAVADVSELAAEDYWKEVKLYHYYAPQKYAHAIMCSVLEKRGEKNKNKYEEITIRSGRYSSITNSQYEPEGDIGYSDYEVTAFNELYYRKILDLCQNNDINVHIIKLPLATNSGYLDDYEEEVEDYYNDLLEDYENAEFYWFHTTYQLEFFYDQYHPNNHGAFRFSRELKELYPEVFEEETTEYSEQTMKAFDMDIANENYLGELTKWVNDKPYTIIFLDNGVDLGEYYYMCVGFDDKWLEPLIDNDVYYLSADGSSFPENVDVQKENDGKLIVTIDDGESVELEPTSNVGISFVVIDNVNNCFVCQRTSDYSEYKFSPLL